MRRRAAAIVLGVIALVMAGCSFGSDPSVSLILPAKVSAGAKVEAQGVYSEKSAGLEVTVMIKGEDEPVATTVTDKDGRYKVTFTPDGTGAQQYVAEVVDASEPAASAPRNLLVLGPTAVSSELDSDAETKVGDKRSLRGVVEPASARTVILEASADGKAWSAEGRPVTSDAKGRFRFVLDTSAQGERYFRATVEESDDRSKASSAEQFLAVYDYARAGKRYEACVEELNRKIGEFNRLEGLQVIKESAVRMANRSSKQADCFRGYSWPPSVQGYIESLIVDLELDADVYHRMSAARTFEELEDLSYEFDEDVQPATQVRAILGLRKRPVG